ncbi:hypothetical protein SERLADRAFT_455561, partial [Serpula lacrymans var. lacrymans S7.9]
MRQASQSLWPRSDLSSSFHYSELSHANRVALYSFTNTSLPFGSLTKSIFSIRCWFSAIHLFCYCFRVCWAIFLF